ncbi:112_t:CDS:1, partial [Dentiscutata erythropus]
DSEELWWPTKYYTIDPKSLEFKHLFQWYRESYNSNIQATQ